MRILPLFLLIALSAPAVTHPQPKLAWSLGGLSSPESVVYDAQRDRLYVSNLATRGEGRTPGDGFISMVSRQGDMLELTWATGMDDPKGLAVANNRLYVADTAELIEVHLDTGKVLNRYRPEDGKSGGFNDCTADPHGNVYVYSSRLGTVHRLHAGRFEPWVKIDTSQTGGINGLRAEADRLVLGGWSLTDANGDKRPGHLNTLRFRDHAQGRIGSEPVAHCDGIEPDGLGGYTVTDWLTGDVKHVSAAGETSPIMTLVRGTADHEYLIESGMLFIPSMLEDKVEAYYWRPTLPE